MKNLFVPYELAVKLKEKGFNENCLATYVRHSEPFIWTGLKGECKNSFCNHLPTEVTAPLWQQVIDWLRDKKRIDISIVPYFDGIKKKYHMEAIRSKTILNTEKVFNEYYLALQSGIEKALELI